MGSYTPPVKSEDTSRFTDYGGQELQRIRKELKKLRRLIEHQQMLDMMEKWKFHNQSSVLFDDLPPFPALLPSKHKKKKWSGGWEL